MRHEVFSSTHVSNLEILTNHNDGFIYRIKDNMVNQLAHKILEAHMFSRDSEFSKEFYMALVVADIDDYWKDVEKKAYEFTTRFNLPSS
jgi:hypothetical protein